MLTTRDSPETPEIGKSLTHKFFRIRWRLTKEKEKLKLGKAEAK